ncbi:unnamed protein product [Chironomus riparius]|uniref:Uncharacterized protein n=1 Tax=Chironomus riparius TaxID=315576 RepID=A0A9N9WRS3_9DIPT|nr:unnamed protein product [Chironomus riparius]
MAFLNIASKPSISSGADLFTVPPTNMTVTEGFFLEIRPTTPLDLISSESAIEFNVPPCQKSYTDMGHTRLRVKAKIVCENGTPLPEGCNAALINNSLHSLFQQINVELNQKVITCQNSLYPFKAYFENLLNYSNEKNGILQTAHFFKDTSHKMLADEENEGYKVRRKIAQQGEFSMEGPLHLDLFNSNKYMLNNVQIGLKFYRSKNEFCVITKTTDASKYKIIITECVLLVRRVQLAAAIMAAHAKTMMTFTAKYPIVRTEMRNILIGKGVQSATLEGFQHNQLPSRIILGFLDSTAFNGSWHSNPFNFEHHDICYLNILSEGNIRNLPLKPSFSTDCYTDAYNSLVYDSNNTFENSSLNISYSDYKGGFMVTIFDLTHDISSNSPFWSLPASGSLRIDLQFSKVLAKHIVAVVYLEYNNLIEINQHREVFLDYAT